MIVVEETTKWKLDFQPNHILFLSDDKRLMYALLNSFTGEQVYFKRPIRIDPKYRTFKIIKKVKVDLHDR